MGPSDASDRLLAMTRSLAKLHEYSVPTKHHFTLPTDPARLFVLAIAVLGDEAVSTINGTSAGATGDQKNATRFSAHFFDAYLRSELDKTLDTYVLLLASSSYYLCDLGTAQHAGPTAGQQRLHLRGRAECR